MTERNREAEGGYKPGIQNFGRYFATGVQSKSDKGVAGAATGSLTLAPGYYSLGVEGNVPFVILKGPSRMQKALSWGETIAIPEGMAATLFNDSYHPGDIVLKGGRDWPTIPRRITVPVDFDVVNLSQTHWRLAPKWPVDTRRARQAFLMYEIGAPPGGISAPVSVLIHGTRKEGSHFTQGGQVPGYSHLLTVPIGPFSYIPLGYNFPDVLLLGTPALLPHCLLDTAQVISFDVLKTDQPVPFDRPMYYVLEY